MNLLLELRESDLGLSGNESFTIPYRLRKCARAVIFNDENKIALIYVSKKQYHKLPGGGIEAGEDITTALEREAREEVGCQIEITDELGLTIEYQNNAQIIQISYCYLAKLIGEPKAPTLTTAEEEAGFELMWVSLDEAIALISKDDPTRFVQKRDLALLTESKRIISVQ